MTLRKKILLVLTLLFLLMLAANFFVIHTWKSSLREGMEGQAVALLNQQCSMLSNEILNGRRILRVMALDDSLRGSGIDAIRSRLRQWTDGQTQFESFYFDDMAGVVYPPSGQSFSVRDRDYFPGILAGEEITGAPIVSRHTGRPVLLLTAPVKTSGSRLKGALAGTLIIQDIIVRVTDSVPLVNGAKMFLFDTRGRLLGSTDAGLNTDLSETDKEKSPAVFALWNTILKLKNPAVDGDYVVHWILIPELNWYLVHTQSISRLLASANKATAVSFLIIAILILLCCGIFIVFERIIIRPVIRLRDAHLKLASGDLSVRVTGEGHDEFSDLANAFNRSVVSLELSELKFRTIFESFPYPIVLNRISDGVYIGINSAAENLFEINRGELIGLSSNDPRIVSDPEASHIAKNKLMTDNRLDNELFRIVRPDGSVIWVIYSTRLITISGEPVALTVLTDVTELKRVEEALRTSESKTRAILDQSFQFMGLLTIDGTLIDVNRSALELAGIPAADVLNKPFWECPWWTHSPELQERLRAAVRTAAAGDSVRFEATNQAADGSLRCVDCSLRPVTDETGNVLFLIPEGRDITERKQVEEAFHESHNLLQAVLDTIPVRVFWKDLDLKYLGCNKPFALDAGKDKPSDLTGKDDYQMPWSAQAELYRSDDLEVISTGKAKINFEELQTTPSGDTICLLTSKIPLLDAKGEIRGIMGTYEDITERKRAEERQLKLTEQLHQSQKMDAIGQLAGGVAHDFNNLLSGIMGSAQLLQFAENLSERQKNYISMILTASERAGNLTKKLLTFSRSGTKASTAVDCLKIVNDTVEILQHTIDKNITITIENRAEQTSVIGDDSLLLNAFMNMGINASHAMLHGGTLSFILENLDLDKNYCEISPFDIKPGNYLDIAVRDTGCGIEPEVVSRIFEPFFTTKEQGKGTGLGLAMVYGTVQEHGGAVTVYSEAGAGTVFHIYLPLDKDQVHHEIISQELQKGTGTILLIDDEELIRITAKGLLESLGYNVILTVNRKEGVKTFTERKDEIDLVILDMIMPVMGGRDAFIKLREIDPLIPILITSGFTKEEHMVLLKEHGVSGFLQKPFRTAELAGKVYKALVK